MQLIKHKFSTDRNAAEFFVTWDHLNRNPDVGQSSLGAMTMYDAVSLSKMFTTLNGQTVRGTRFTGYDTSTVGPAGQYIVTHGDYGFLILAYKDDEVKLIKSDTYVFKHLPDGVVDNMDALVLHALLYTQKIPALVQWFDTVYRSQTGRHVSPHFDAVKHLDKCISAVVPGLLFLEKAAKENAYGQFAARP